MRGSLICNLFPSHLMAYNSVFIAALVIRAGRMPVRHETHIVVLVHIRFTDIVAIIVIICAQSAAVTFVLHI